MSYNILDDDDEFGERIHPMLSEYGDIDHQHNKYLLKLRRLGKLRPVYVYWGLDPDDPDVGYVGSILIFLVEDAKEGFHYSEEELTDEDLEFLEQQIEKQSRYDY